MKVATGTGRGHYAKHLGRAERRESRRAEETTMLNRTGWAAAIVYAVGCWVYGVAYIWEHWAGWWDFGMLAYYAFMRALVWPLWVILDLI